MLDGEGGVFGGHLFQGLADFRLGALAGPFDGKAVHGLGQGDGIESQIFRDLARMKHIVELDLVDLCHRPDVPGDDLIGFGVVLAEEGKDMCDPERLLGVVQARVGTRSDGALMHPENAKLADERVG